METRLLLYPAGVVSPLSPTISLVVPAYNEEAYLPRLLDTVEVARKHYRRGFDGIEVIVADNASTDDTAEIARGRHCRVAPVEKRAIAAARNGGAAIAQGEILCFVDADSQIHPESFNVIEEGLTTGIVAGATGIQMERWSVGLAVTWALMIPLVIISRMDTGIVFCRREDFQHIGGYNEDRLFAEDVEFLLAMRRLGKTRRQRLARLTSARAIASTRKWDQYGEWHFLTQMLRLGVMALRSPGAMNDFARKYWYEDR